MRIAGKYLNMSPRIIENTIAGMTGGIGRSLLQTSDEILRVFGVDIAPEREERSPGNVVPLLGPLINALTVKEPTLNSRSVERFHRILRESSAVVATVNTLEKELRFDEAKIISENAQPEVLAHQTLVRINGSIRALYDTMRLIRTVGGDATRQEREAELKQIGLAIRTMAAGGVIFYRGLANGLESAVTGPPIRGLGTKTVPRN